MKGPLILYSGIKNGDINFEKAEKVQKEFDQIWAKNLMEYKSKEQKFSIQNMEKIYKE